MEHQLSKKRRIHQILLANHRYSILHLQISSLDLDCLESPIEASILVTINKLQLVQSGDFFLLKNVTQALSQDRFLGQNSGNLFFCKFKWKIEISYHSPPYMATPAVYHHIKSRKSQKKHICSPRCPMLSEPNPKQNDLDT